MPPPNQDKTIPIQPAIDGPPGILVLTNNFTIDPPPPKNPIFWGPNQPYNGPEMSDYAPPLIGRAKELLSIPKVTRMCIGPPGSAPIAPALLGAGSGGDGPNVQSGPGTPPNDFANNVHLITGSIDIFPLNGVTTWDFIGLPWAGTTSLNGGFWHILKIKIIKHRFGDSGIITSSILFSGRVDTDGTLIDFVGSGPSVSITEEVAVASGSQDSGEYEIDVGYQVKVSRDGITWFPPE